jgi:hypothetical protein
MAIIFSPCRWPCLIALWGVCVDNSRACAY